MPVFKYVVEPQRRRKMKTKKLMNHEVKMIKKFTMKEYLEAVERAKKESFKVYEKRIAEDGVSFKIEYSNEGQIRLTFSQDGEEHRFAFISGKFNLGFGGASYKNDACGTKDIYGFKYIKTLDNNGNEIIDGNVLDRFSEDD